MVDYDDTGSIGKRYRRQDEIGTPYCITVDFQTVGDEKTPADNCVTIRKTAPPSAREILAGLTTFMTMAYIIALNPNLLTNFDTGSALWNGVFLATCIASALAMFCMAFLANKPFALAPGMGLNSFFAVVVSNIVSLTGMSYLESFQSALVIILLEGIVFLILSVLNIREKIVDAIPWACAWASPPPSASCS